jgi:hypothetical protein
MANEEPINPTAASEAVIQSVIMTTATGDRVLRELVGGGKEIGGVEIEWRDFRLIDELHQIEGLFGFEAHRVQLVVVQQYVFALLVLVALLDLIGGHRPYALDYLLVVDTLSRGLVDLVERGRRPGFVGREHLDIDRNQAQPELAFPDRTRRGHGRPLFCTKRDDSTELYGHLFRAHCAGSKRHISV